MRRRDDGFTMAELLLSVAILLIIVSSLVSALLVFLDNGQEALERDDHSGGAAVLGSYLDRDIASARTVVVGGSACSDSANLMAMSWQDVTATAAAPEPTPSGPVFTSAYRVASDPASVPGDGSARYKLERVHCESADIVDTATLLTNLVSATSATAVVVADSNCASGEALTFELDAYLDDSTEPYTFRSCTKTRLTP